MVGGAVRNALMRLPVDEIDVATTAVPDEVMRRVEAAGFKAVPTGIEHGTVTVVIDGKPFEVTTLRTGRRDLRPQGQGRVRPRLGERMPAARFHHQRAVGVGRRRRFTITSAASPISPRAVCASSATRRNGSPKIICASCGSFAFTPGMAKAPPDADGLHACIVARAGLDTLSRERVRVEIAEAVASRRTRRRRSR